MSDISRDIGFDFTPQEVVDHINDTHTHRHVTEEDLERIAEIPDEVDGGVSPYAYDDFVQADTGKLLIVTPVGDTYKMGVSGGTDPVTIDRLNNLGPIEDDENTVDQRLNDLDNDKLDKNFPSDAYKTLTTDSDGDVTLIGLDGVKVMHTDSNGIPSTDALGADYANKALTTDGSGNIVFTDKGSVTVLKKKQDGSQIISPGTVTVITMSGGNYITLSAGTWLVNAGVQFAGTTGRSTIETDKWCIRGICISTAGDGSWEDANGDRKICLCNINSGHNCSTILEISQNTNIYLKAYTQGVNDTYSGDANTRKVQHGYINAMKVNM